MREKTRRMDAGLGETPRKDAASGEAPRKVAASGNAPRGHAWRKAAGLLWGSVFTIALWWLLALAVDSPALPTPAATWPALVANMPRMLPELGVSAFRLLAGLAIGAALGVPAGLALGRSRRADELLGPVLYVLYPLPKIVLLPVLFILFGLGGQTKIVLIAIVVFFQLAVTMRDAARNVPDAAVVSLRSLKATRRQVFSHVVVPATLPDLFTGLRVTCGISVAILFIAESMAGSSGGLGYFVMHSYSLLEYEQMFAGIVVFAVFGIVLYEAFDVAERRLTRWRRM